MLCAWIYTAPSLSPDLEKSVLALKIDGKPDMRASPPCRKRIPDANEPSEMTTDPCLVSNSVAEDKGNDCSDVCWIYSCFTCIDKQFVITPFISSDLTPAHGSAFHSDEAFASRD